MIFRDIFYLKYIIYTSVFLEEIDNIYRGRRMKDHIGFGALNEALLSLENGGFAKALVVASGSGWRRFNTDGERPFLSNRALRLFSGFSANPDILEIMAGGSILRDFCPDVIIALGGGSAMDTAKMMKAVAFTKEAFSPASPAAITPSGEGPPLVAISTTSGSGAEATQFAVFYKGEEKQSVAHPSLRPEMAVVDPELTYSLPPAQTAATGFDALSQAVEAYWGSASNPEAREFASSAIRYTLPNIYNAVSSPAPGNRYHMAQAAYLAGKAINSTRTTMPHALAYHLTKRYGLPHGHAVAVTLPHFFHINSNPRLPVNAPGGTEENQRVMREVFTLLGQDTAEDCFVFWRNLMKACGLAASLHDVGVDNAEKVRALVDSMDAARQKNNPVAISADELTAYLVEHCDE